MMQLLFIIMATPSARRFSAAKALEIILAGSGSEDDEIDIDREVGTRSDDDFIPDQAELSDSEDWVTRRPKATRTQSGSNA
jgi:hypothetical protein